MDFLVVDDEPAVLKDVGRILKETVPDGKFHFFSAPSQALSWAAETTADIALLDIELGCISGLVLAKELKELQPDIHIIFVTGHAKYAVSAFEIHATGYLMKPVSAADIRRELTFLYGGSPGKRTVRIQTFGGFGVFVNEQGLKFGRAKSKELLACLVDKRGVDMTTREICNLLWDDGIYNRMRKNYFQVLLGDLRATLRQAGVEDILVCRWNSFAVNPNSFDCDSYRFLDGDPLAINMYRHNYLPSYSWAEFTVGKMENSIQPGAYV